MRYDHQFVSLQGIPSALPLFHHIAETYVSETNKTASVWMQFGDADLEFKPHIKSTCVREIMQHQLLSERRFFREFLGHDEPDAGSVLPEVRTVASFCERMVALASPRVPWLGSLTEEDWLTERPFFDKGRQRIWIFWRRVLHSGHHRTQLTVYLRLLDKPVPSTYGPTADVTWDGADPTTTIEAAQRQNSGMR